MTQTPEMKVAEQIANLTESHWFNPATFGRILSDQPLYTIDRIMEMVSYILRKQAVRFESEKEHGQTSEGLFLANELNDYLEQLTAKYDWQNLKLPQ